MSAERGSINIEANWKAIRVALAVLAAFTAADMIEQGFGDPTDNPSYTITMPPDVDCPPGTINANITPTISEPSSQSGEHVCLVVKPPRSPRP